MNVGLMLRYYRKLSGITQEEVAERAGINEKYYGRIERNESVPTIDKFFAVCEAMKIEPARLCFALSNKDNFEYLLINRRKDLIAATYVGKIVSTSLAEVDMGGLKEIVYAGKETNLFDYIDCNYQTVLLQKISDDLKMQYRYALFALKSNNVSLISNQNVIQDMFEELYYIGALEGYTIYGMAEHKVVVEEYQCDYYFQKEKLLIENQILVGKESKAMYPAGPTDCVKKRLESICRILRKGYNVRYNIFILSIWSNTLSWESEIRQLIEEAQILGMQIMLYYLYYENGVLMARAAQLKKVEDNLYEIVFVRETESGKRSMNNYIENKFAKRL